MVDPLSAAGVGLGVAELARKRLRNPVARRRLVAKVRRETQTTASASDLRRWVKQPRVRDLLVDARPAAIAELATTLSPLIPGSSDAEATEVASAFARSLIGSLDAAEAVDAASRRTMGALSEIAEGQRSMAQANLERNAFDEIVLRTPPGCIQPLRDLHRINGQLAEQIAAAIVANGRSGGELATEWAADPSPPFLSGAPWQAWMTVAALGDAFEVADASNRSYLRAVDLGAPNAGLLLARQAAAIHDRGESNEASELLGRAAARDPSSAVVRATAAAFDDDADRVLELLVDVESTDPLEAGQILALRQWAHVQREEPERVARELEAFVDRFPERGMPKLALAQSMLVRSQGPIDGSSAMSADLRRAEDLALEVRDQFRMWAGPSERAVLVACEAALLSDDPHRVLQLALRPPAGDANDQEAADDQVRAEAARAALLSGDQDLALELAAHLSRPFDRTLMDSIIARRDDNIEAARERAVAAFDLAANPGEEFAALYALALLGEWPLPGLDALRAGNEAVADLVEAMALHSRGDHEQAIGVLRGRADTNAHAAQMLAGIYAETGRIDQAAETALRAARRLGAGMQYIAAADLLASSGELGQALDVISEALASGILRASEEDHLRRRQIEIFGQRGEWPAVEREARLLLERTADDEVRWVLATALYNQGHFERAWRVIEDPPLDPDTAYRTRLRMELARRYAPGSETVEEILRFAEQHVDSEEFVAAALGAIYAMRPSPELPPETLARLHQATEDFVQRFPDSPGLRQMSAEEPEDFLEQIKEILAPGAEQLLEIGERIANGELPLGMFAVVRGAPYASALVHRAPGCLVVETPDTGARGVERQAAQLALDETIVVDASTLSLAAAIPEIWKAIRANAHELVVADWAVRDAVAARDELSMLSTSSISYDPRVQAIRLHEIDDETAVRLADHAAELARLALTCVQHPVGGIDSVPDADLQRVGPWLGAIEAAVARGVPLLADDVALRTIARERGVPAFGSTAFCNAMKESGRLSESDEAAILDTLAEHFCVDLSPDAERTIRLARSSNWHPGPASFAISRPQYWAEAQTAIRSFQHIRSILASEAPEQIAHWTYCAILGACARRPPVEANQIAGGLLVGALSHLDWPYGGHFQEIVDAASAAATERNAGDPLETVTRQLFDQFNSDLGDPSLAAGAVLVAVRDLDPERRLSVLRTLLDVREDDRG